MADFDPPFASVGGVNRAPTTDEQSDGFQCGAADLTLFNRLFGRIEAELKAIQDAGGIAGSEGDDTTVLQAIEALIAAATGGGDTSQFVLFTQAQARLPIFPEVTTDNGVITPTDLGTGNIRIPASKIILHRGIRTYTTVQTDLATVLSKTYHLRWNPTTGFALKDLADTGSYNPTSAAETSSIFDSTYDDMLVARIVTNSSNVPTITPLINTDRLTRSVRGTNTPIFLGTGAYSMTVSETLNWARTPKIKAIAGVLGAGSISPSGAMEGVANLMSAPTVTRYSASATVSTDWADTSTIGSLFGYVDFNLGA
ncbi:MAG: hypothetical protein ACK4SQ_14200 [Allorhizobium sp.]